MPPLSPFDLDNVIVALITGLISFTVAYITSRSQAKNDEKQSKKIQVEIETELREQLRETDHRVGQLSDLLGQEQEKRRDLKNQLTTLELKDDIKTAYIRSVGHWLADLCEVLEPAWSKKHPKPHLPAEIRHDIEHTAQQVGLQVNQTNKEK
ncbi:hypothetical protein EJ419_07375 [Alloscardovia theropitheci]|uniref:Uncharacterized protein n=1 Tax=Alloscardovia theropitheci TaxID=2496842 RepID=A0A4V2MTT9_9BIFI|nr:hypothetical protein [Alloscardovia theropitheci]TCD53779.1 hypothetical protein EJ419_07375 [Alloscardovia theropitheci]